MDRDKDRDKDRDRDEDEFICQSAITERYKVPKRLIGRFLPNPTLVANPHYRSAPPMKLYRITDVENILMKEEEVMKAVERHGKLSESSRKAVETKLKRMRERLERAIGGDIGGENRG